MKTKKEQHVFSVKCSVSLFKAPISEHFSLCLYHFHHALYILKYLRLNTKIKRLFFLNASFEIVQNKNL